MDLNEFEKAQFAYDGMQMKEYDINNVMKKFSEIINENKNEISKIVKIENSNNFFVDIDSILNIKNRKKINTELEQRKREDNFIVSKYKENYGVLGIIFNGDTYVTIELLKMLLNTKNAMIFCTSNKRFAITKLIILYFKQALKICGYDEEIVQIINSENYIEMYNHNNILKKIIVIGNKDLQNSVLSKSNMEVIKSGYGSFDLYIEDIMDIDLIKKIINEENIELNIYINKNIEPNQIENLEIDDYTEIENIEECIRDVNINSAGYSSSIFTKNPENANKFLKLVRSKNVFVNASPTAERTLDIVENDILYTKQVMYSNN